MNAGQQRVAGVEQRVDRQIEAGRARRNRSGALVDRRVRHRDRGAGAGFRRSGEGRDSQISADLDRSGAGVVRLVRFRHHVRGIGLRDEVVRAGRRIGRDRDRERRRVADARVELRDAVIRCQRRVACVEQRIDGEEVAGCRRRRSSGALVPGCLADRQRQSRAAFRRRRECRDDEVGSDLDASRLGVVRLRGFSDDPRGIGNREQVVRARDRPEWGWSPMSSRY